jgi:hypothetical protein
MRIPIRVFLERPVRRKKLKECFWRNKVMKLSAKIMLLACLILAVPASSFALVDVGAYGGYSFAGELKTDSGTVDTSGFLYGFNAHVNFDMLVFFQLGIGGFYQKSEFDYDMTGGGDSSYDKTVVGVDLYAMLNIPMLPISPYVTFNSGIWEKVDDKYARASTDYFQTYSVGGGVALTILPIPAIMSLSIFGEYLYNFGKDAGNDATGHQVRLGVRGDFL